MESRKGGRREREGKGKKGKKTDKWEGDLLHYF